MWQFTPERTAERNVYTVSNITMSRSRYFWNSISSFIGRVAASNLYHDVRKGWHPPDWYGLTLLLGLLRSRYCCFS